MIFCSSLVHIIFFVSALYVAEIICHYQVCGNGVYLLEMIVFMTQNYCTNALYKKKTIYVCCALLIDRPRLRTKKEYPYPPVNVKICLINICCLQREKNYQSD